MKRALFVVLLSVTTILGLGQIGAAQTAPGGVGGIIQSVKLSHDTAGRPYVEVEVLRPDDTVGTVRLEVTQAKELDLLTQEGEVDDSKLGHPFQFDVEADAEAIHTPTPWGTPVLVSPSSAAAFSHYPRTTTLLWQPVTGAVTYRVERAYYSGVWTPYPDVNVPGNTNTSYTFDFVGDQSGRWRVTAFNGSIWSTPSAWRTFSYNTRAQMPTPVLTGPSSNVVLHNYPRTMTVSWKMIPAAVGYKVEIMYCLADRVTCWPFAPVIINDGLKSSHTFTFVGAQPGKWRVTALGGSQFRDSAASSWRWFSFGI